MRDGPTGRRRAGAEPLLVGEVIDFVNDAVDVVAQLGTVRFDCAIMRDHKGRAVAEAGEVVHLEAEGPQPFERAVLRASQRLAENAPGVGVETQRPAGGDRRVQLAKASGGGVARVREGLCAPHLLPDVQRGEVVVGHVDFAANLQPVRRAGERPGNVVHRPGVPRHVLADLAVSAGRRADQPTVLVEERKGEPIDLRLRRVVQRRIG